MTLVEMCELIQLDQEVVETILENDSIYNRDELSFMWEKLYSRTIRDEGLEKLQEYFGDDKNAEMYCDSWLLSSALKRLLTCDSNFLYFKNSFEIICVDEENIGLLQWIYIRKDLLYDNFPEVTSLQCEAKKLLEGGKIGRTFGKLIGCF